MEKLYSLMIEGQDIRKLMVNGRVLYNPETGEEMQIADILSDGSQADPAEYDKRMGLAAGRLDEYMEKVMNEGQFDTASGLSGDYEYEARLNGFIMGFKAALQLMDPEAEV